MSSEHKVGKPVGKWGHNVPVDIPSFFFKFDVNYKTIIFYSIFSFSPM